MVGTEDSEFDKIVSEGLKVKTLSEKAVSEVGLIERKFEVTVTGQSPAVVT